MKKPRMLWASPHRFGRAFSQIMSVVAEASKHYPDTFKLEVLPCDEMTELQAKYDKAIAALREIEEHMEEPDRVARRVLKDIGELEGV